MLADVVFEALAEPRRRQILDLLHQREHTVNELVAALRIPQPNVSKHLRVLREAGLVTSRTNGPQRIYSIDATPLKELDDWVARYRGLWTHALDQLEGHLDATARRRRGGNRGR